MREGGREEEEREWEEGKREERDRDKEAAERVREGG